MVTENTDQPIEDVAQTQPADVIATAAEAPSEKTFSQDEVNRMMAQTKRDTRQQYSDYNDLQKRAARADELEHEKLTDTEKLEARAVEAERKATDAQQQIASAMIASEVKVHAIAMGIVDPDAAFLLLDRKNVAYSNRGQTISEVEQQDAEYQSGVRATCNTRQAIGTTTGSRPIHGTD